jgi:hypothetical protein
MMRRRARLSTAPPDLNLVPLLDMVSLLVQVLLLHVHFGALAELPATPVGAPSGEDSGSLALSVDIGEGGYIVRWNDEEAGRSEVLGCNAPCTDLEHWPTAELGHLLSSIKDDHPTDEQAVVRPLTDVRFDVVARTMDLVREVEGRPLFPQISIGRSK